MSSVTHFTNTFRALLVACLVLGTRDQEGEAPTPGGVRVGRRPDPQVGQWQVSMPVAGL